LLRPVLLAGFVSDVLAVGRAGAAPQITDENRTLIIVALSIAILSLLLTIVTLIVACYALRQRRRTGESSSPHGGGTLPLPICAADFHSFADAEMGEVGLAAVATSVPRGLPRLRSPQEQRGRACTSKAVIMFENLLRNAKTSGGEIVDVSVEDFLVAHEVWGECLSLAKAGLGIYISMNTKCIRGMKEIDWSKKIYSEFLFSELNIHVKNKKDDYVGDSAWNSNRWIHHVNELFIMIFQGMLDGLETKVAVANAYKETLMAHHTFIMKRTFLTGTAILPNREKMLDMIKGPDGTIEELLEDFDIIVRVFPVVQRYIKRLDTECQALLDQHKPKK